MTTEPVDTDCCAQGGCCSDCCCDKCCCTMPHGKLVLFPTIMLTIAAAVSMISLCNCTFVEGESSYYYYAGLWPGCVYAPYSSSFASSVHQNDAARKTAMSFGLIACIVGVGAMVSLWPITCKTYPPCGIHVIGGTVVFVFLSQLATLSMFGTEYCWEIGCRLGAGGVLSIIAAVLWLISAIGVWVIPKKPIERSEGGGAMETVTITETIQADGTKVTKRVTTSPDGTKTIEETIQSPVAVASGDNVEQPQDIHKSQAVHAVAVAP